VGHYARNGLFTAFLAGFGLVCLVQTAFATHDRPISATPSYIPLTPSFLDCTSPNTTYAPTGTPACTSAVPTSPNVTVGTPDANGAPANSTGFVRLRFDNGPSSNDADLAIIGQITDVRCLAAIPTCGPSNTLAGPDYTGELQGSTVMRITDHNNAPTSSGPFTDTATVADIPFPPFVLTCASTASATIGSTCTISTSGNSITPGMIVEGKRMNAGLTDLIVNDGGSDGLATTPGNSTFQEQGLFVP
jgi:hypothetical protein